MVEADGTVVAFAVADSRDGSLWALFVDPEYEGKGYDRRLHDAAVTWLFDRGHDRIWLTTSPGTRAQRFYELAGWTEAGAAPNRERRFELSKPAPTGRTRLDRNLGLFMIALWIVSNGWWLLPPRFDAARALPLHVCDITSLLAGIVLLYPRRSLRALLYFWGIGMSPQAIVTPEIAFDPHTIWFWIFWMSHAGIIAIAIYDIVARGFRPTWADFRLSVLAGLVYLAVVLAINIALGFNYGYVGNARPGEASIIDFLGPWPQRVVLMVALVIGLMALLMAPWHFARRLTKAR